MSELMGLTPVPAKMDPQLCEAAMPASSVMHAKLVKADFHGAIISGKSSSGV